MAKNKTIFVCAACGARSPRADGRCLRCGAWDSLAPQVEEAGRMRVGVDAQSQPIPIGEVPLVGFFCNGEISHDRLYGYTGVLTLFQ